MNLDRAVLAANDRDLIPVDDEHNLGLPAVNPSLNGNCAVVIVVFAQRRKPAITKISSTITNTVTALIEAS